MRRVYYLFTVAALTLFLIACAVFSVSCGAATPESAELLILMYHRLDTIGDGNVTVSPEAFESQLNALETAGYTAVSFDDVIAYVDNGEPLPNKPVCIVFDDGYESNFTLAFPILQKHDTKAVMCIIGSSVGCDEYKDTGKPIIPHFSWEQARILHDSGLVTIASHTYDMHMYAPNESGVVREWAARLPDESESEFAAAFRADHKAMCALMLKNLGCTPTVFAYPHGKWDVAAEEILKELGVRVTLITEVGVNTVERGNPNSLYLLRRFSMNEYTDIEEILGLA